MKKLLIIIFLLTWTGTSWAQSGGVQFHQGNWNSLLNKARNARKPFFVDVYTTWCGPCKAMSRNTFANAQVGSFANSNFIAYKIDAEKGEGPQIARKYRVNAYPTVLFFNAQGQLAGREVGYKNAAKFIEVMQKYKGSSSQNNNNNSRPGSAQATIFEHSNYKGKFRSFGEGRYNVNQLGIGDNQLSSVKVMPGYTVRVYENANYQGRYIDYTSSTAFVGNTWNDKASSILVMKTSSSNNNSNNNNSNGVVTIYEHSNYKGKAQSFREGKFNINQLGIGNDQLSSVRVSQGYILRVYEHANYQGRYIDFTASKSFVGNTWNDKASSVMVMKAKPNNVNNTPTNAQITIYEHSNFRGKSKSFGVGSYNINQLGIGNDQLSSIKIPRGYKVRIYEHSNFGGKYRDYTQSSGFVGNDWNDKTSSLKVMRVQ